MKREKIKRVKRKDFIDKMVEIGFTKRQAKWIYSL